MAAKMKPWCLNRDAMLPSPARPFSVRDSSTTEPCRTPSGVLYVRVRHMGPSMRAPTRAFRPTLLRRYAPGAGGAWGLSMPSARAGTPHSQWPSPDWKTWLVSRPADGDALDTYLCIRLPPCHAATYQMTDRRRDLPLRCT